jgi:purine nucleosidase
VTRKLVIDTDGGVDDAVALWWALTAPDVEVVAVVATWGNVERDVAAVNLLRILHHAGRTDIPVALGADGPIGPAPLDGISPHVHGIDGLGGFGDPWHVDGLSAVAEPGADLLARLAAEHPGELDLVTIGPLSTVAEALDAHPEIVGGYRSLTVMGGSILAGGNALPWAEANIAHDPLAASKVVTAAWKTEQPPLLVGLDVTKAALLTLDEHVAAARASGLVSARMLVDALEFYAGFYASAGHKPDRTFPCHDLLAVLAAAEVPVITEAPEYPLGVDTGGSAAWGATIVDRRPNPEVDVPGFVNWRIAMRVDEKPFHQAFNSLL